MKKRPTKRRMTNKKALHKAKTSRPTSAADYMSRSPQFQDKWNRVVHTISKMRADRSSLQNAATEFDVDSKVVLRLGRSALRKTSSGRYKARASDKLLRVLQVPTPEGLQEVITRDSREASKLARFSDAIQKYLQTGDSSGLKRFRRYRATNLKGKKIQLLTDLDELTRQGSAGVLSFESLYARTA